MHMELILPSFQSTKFIEIRDLHAFACVQGSEISPTVDHPSNMDKRVTCGSAEKYNTQNSQQYTHTVVSMKCTPTMMGTQQQHVTHIVQ